VLIRPRASSGFLIPAAEHRVDIHVELGPVVRAGPAAFPVEQGAGSSWTHRPGSTLSMLICRKSRPASFRAPDPFRHEEVAVRDEPGQHPARANVPNEIVEGRDAASARPPLNATTDVPSSASLSMRRFNHHRWGPARTPCRTRCSRAQSMLQRRIGTTLDEQRGARCGPAHVTNSRAADRALRLIVVVTRIVNYNSGRRIRPDAASGPPPRRPFNEPFEDGADRKSNPKSRCRARRRREPGRRDASHTGCSRGFPPNWHGTIFVDRVGGPSSASCGANHALVRRLGADRRTTSISPLGQGELWENRNAQPLADRSSTTTPAVDWGQAPRRRSRRSAVCRD